MALRYSDTLRTSRCQALVTACGANARGKFYNGAKPGTKGTTPAGTLLGTVVFGTTIGTVTAGVLDFDEASITQTNSSHVNGTPTFVVFETSGGTFVADLDIGAGAGNMTFTGTIATNQNISLASSTITEGNA